jgi:hypothetical protein
MGSANHQKIKFRPLNPTRISPCKNVLNQPIEDFFRLRVIGGRIRFGANSTAMAPVVPPGPGDEPSSTKKVTTQSVADSLLLAPGFFQCLERCLFLD